MTPIVVMGGCAACTDPAAIDAGPDSGDGTGGVCTTDLECPGDQLCTMGTCTDPAIRDAGQTGDGDDAGSSGEPDAGGPVGGILAVTPETTLEFGAQLIGVPVSRTVQLQNVGTIPVTIAAIILDDDSGEFSTDVSGTVQETLDVGDVFSLNISHTPSDGVPDEAEVTILHDGVDNLITLELFAEFKGAAAVSITNAASTLEPLLEELDVGEADPVLGLDVELFVRNTGAPDSVLSVDSLTLTPQNAGFTLDQATLDEIPRLLGANSHHLCPNEDVADCVAEAAACTDMVCLNDDGHPLSALTIPVHFDAQAGETQATLSIVIQDGTETETYDVLLVGRPTQPVLMVDPTTVDFGTVLVGAPSPTTTVTVTNGGAGPLHLTMVELPVADVYDVVPEAPVPTQMGHVPVVLAMGETFTFDATFTPTENGMASDVLSLHTNDVAVPIINISMSGTGLQCQANAEVDMTGECVCLPGFNACGAECIADSPESCGPSCTDCTSYTGAVGTDAQCDTGTCTFSCQEAWYDVDNDLGGDFTDAGFDGCEYLCPQNPALSFEICNGVDDNCEGSVDEGLPPDTDDISGGNELCNGAAVITDNVPAAGSNITNGGSATIQRTIYPTADNDWFRIMVEEADGSLGCAEDLPCLEGGAESYRAIFEVTSPSNASFNLEVFAPDSFSTSGNPNTTAECGQSGTTMTGNNLVHNYTRSSDIFDCLFCLGIDACPSGGLGCGFDDYQVYYVRVKPDDSDPDNFSCEEYNLTIKAHQVL